MSLILARGPTRLKVVSCRADLITIVGWAGIIKVSRPYCALGNGPSCKPADPSHDSPSNPYNPLKNDLNFVIFSLSNL